MRPSPPRACPPPLALAAAAITVLALRGHCAPAREAAPKRIEADFIVACEELDGELDPAKGASPRSPLSAALFEGLLSRDPRTAAAVPAAAEGWELSTDNKKITFTLRKDAAWSDGARLVASDFVRSWLRALDPHSRAERADLIWSIVAGAEAVAEGRPEGGAFGATALDDRRLEVALREGVSPRLAIEAFAHPAFLPVPLHAITLYGERWTDPGRMVGNGPYTLLSRSGEYAILARNSRYWDSKGVALARIGFVPLDERAFDRYLRGEIDWCAGTPPGAYEKAKARKDFRASEGSTAYGLVFNLARPPLDDGRVRRALALAVDRRSLVSSAAGPAYAPTSTLAPTLAGYSPPAGTGYDPNAAKKLLAEAGYPAGSRFPALSLLSNPGDLQRAVAERLRRAWADNLGISIEPEERDWASFQGSVSTGGFGIARAGWSIDAADPAALLGSFSAKAEGNEGSYANPSFDALLREADTRNGAERAQLLKKAETLLVETDQAVLPLFRELRFNLIDTSKWSGWYDNPLDCHPLKSIRRK